MTKISPDQVVAVILAGGFGTRVKLLLGNVPKPMAMVAGKPCVEWIVRYLVKQGLRRIVISTGYRAEVIEHHFAARPVPNAIVRCVAETKPLGTAGAFFHAVHSSAESPPGWLVVNGDTLVFADLSGALAVLDDPVTAGVIYGYEAPDAARYGTLLTDARGNLSGFEEKRPGKGVISTGVYLFRDSLVKTFPGRVPLSLEQEVFPALTRSGVCLKVLKMSAPFLDIGTPESLPQADAFVQENLAWFDLDPI